MSVVGFFLCGKCESDNLNAPGVILIKRYPAFCFIGKISFHFLGLNTLKNL